MRKCLVPALLVVALPALLALVWRADAQEPNNVEAFMRLKLQHSQNVLEGLTTKNFDQIASNAQKLSLISHETLWQVLQTPEYQQQSGEFRRSADAMTKAAREQNLDGAALAYLEMTMRCIKCHEYVRDVRMVSLPRDSAWR